MNIFEIQKDYKFQSGIWTTHVIKAAQMPPVFFVEWNQQCRSSNQAPATGRGGRLAGSIWLIAPSWQWASLINGRPELFVCILCCVLCVRPPLQNQHVRTWGNSRNFDLSGCCRQESVYTRCRSPTLRTAAGLWENVWIILLDGRRRRGFPTSSCTVSMLRTRVLNSWWTTIICNKIFCQMQFIYKFLENQISIWMGFPETSAAEQPEEYSPSYRVKY